MGMRNFATVLLCATLALVLGGCATVQKKPDFAPVYITNTTRFYLLSPKHIEQPIATQQQLSASFGQDTFYLLSYLEADENGIFLSLFNDFGTGMGTLSYDGATVQFDSAVFPKQLKGEYVLADLQFAYYAPEALRAELSKIGMTFLVTQENDGQIRKIIKKGKLIEEITKKDGVITIKNKLRGYEYTLQEAED